VSAALLRDGVTVGPVEVARSRRRRARGLLGRDGVDGALVLRPCRHVHTIGMRFPIDVACCAADGRVLRVARLAPGRLSRPVLRAAFVVEAEAGAFARWGVEPGSVLTVEEHA
jgi:uncharacterized membrane protein (UPF0127 family)